MYVEHPFPDQVLVLHPQGILRRREPLLTYLAEVVECGHAGIVALQGIAIGQSAGLLGLRLCLIALVGGDGTLPGLADVLLDALAGIVVGQSGILEVHLGGADAGLCLEGVEKGYGELQPYQAV